jgi:hypothetical protein
LLPEGVTQVAKQSLVCLQIGNVWASGILVSQSGRIFFKIRGGGGGGAGGGGEGGQYLPPTFFPQNIGKQSLWLVGLTRRGHRRGVRREGACR